eukprot:353847-Chlamydomonas_euryale.AAC.1
MGSPPPLSCCMSVPPGAPPSPSRRALPAPASAPSSPYCHCSSSLLQPPPPSRRALPAPPSAPRSTPCHCSPAQNSHIHLTYFLHIPHVLPVALPAPGPHAPSPRPALRPRTCTMPQPPRCGCTPRSPHPVPPCPAAAHLHQPHGCAKRVGPPDDGVADGDAIDCPARSVEDGGDGQGQVDGGRVPGPHNLDHAAARRMTGVGGID